MSDNEIPCQDFVELVTDYLEGVIEPDRQALVEEHLAQCPGCRRYLDQMRLMIALAGQVQEPDLSAEAWQELRQAFRALTES